MRRCGLQSKVCVGRGHTTQARPQLSEAPRPLCVYSSADEVTCACKGLAAPLAVAKTFDTLSCGPTRERERERETAPLRLCLKEHSPPQTTVSTAIFVTVTPYGHQDPRLPESVPCLRTLLKNNPKCMYKYMCICRMCLLPFSLRVCNSQVCEQGLRSRMLREDLLVWIRVSFVGYGVEGTELSVQKTNTPCIEPSECLVISMHPFKISRVPTIECGSCPRFWRKGV